MKEADYIVAVRSARLSFRSYKRVKGTKKCEAARKFLRAIEKLANLYSSDEFWKDGQPLRAMPDDIIAILGERAAFLATGKIPHIIRDCGRGRGTRSVVPPERRAIETAVAYVYAARNKFLSDPAPIKTISREFSVHRRTVEGWVGKFTAAKCDISKLHDLMRCAGRQYSEQGRSAAAISRRDKKRSPRDKKQ